MTIGALDYVMMSRLGLVEADTNEAGEIELEIHALGVSDSAVEISGPICVGSARLGSGPRTTSGRALAWAASTPW